VNWRKWLLSLHGPLQLALPKYALSVALPAIIALSSVTLLLRLDLCIT